MPAAAAIATTCNVKLVDPPVANRPTNPFTIVFSEIMSLSNPT